MRQYDLVTESPVGFAAEPIAEYITDSRYGPGQLRAACVCAWLAIRDNLPKDATFEYVMEHFNDLVKELSVPAAKIYNESEWFKDWKAKREPYLPWKKH